MTSPASLAAALSNRYRLDRELGLGGMATVYLAHDLRNDRQVALKVLRPELAAVLGPERFLAEIKTTANLQHPHILPLFDSGQAGSFLFYVMPFNEGESLRDRLNREKQLPIAEALRIATAIASALDYAHRRGVLHRDIKPENILLHDEQALVADFGIALAMRKAGGARLTETGLSLGTPQYMSPEQATAERELDARTDIYALGAVTYEMLTGEPPFTGTTTQAVIAKLMTETPRRPSVLRKAVPPALEAAVLTALEKLPADRFASAAEFAEALEGGRAEGRKGGRTARVSARLRWAAWGAVAVVAILAAATIARWRRGQTVPPPTITRFAVPVPTGYESFFGETPILAISPDGTNLVYGTEGCLYLRQLDRFEARPIPGTDGATSPFFSPDGAWLGFVQGAALMKAPVAGGPSVKIASAFVVGGAAWGPGDRIVFSGALGNGGLWSVSAAGGTPVQITTVSDSAKETQHMWPDLLPDGAVLYTVLGPSGHAVDARLVVQDLERKTRTVVVEGATYGRFVEPGYLLYADGGGTLLLQPFDLHGRRTTGPARAVLAGGRLSNWGGAVPFALSATGTLAYITGTEFEESLLSELDLNGRERRHFGVPRSIEYPALSPDGRQLALTIRSPSNDDIWLMDVATGRFDRFSFDPSEDESPIWAPDGRRVAYSSAAVGEQRRLFVKTVGSAEPARLVYTSKRHFHLSSWSPDGHWLALYEFEPLSVDVWLLNLDDPSRLLPVATSPAAESDAVFSPDGRWLAYCSDESGRSEVYVVSFPDLGAKQQVSREGGCYPQWSATGEELFLFDRSFMVPGQMMLARRAGVRATAWQQPAPLFKVSKISSFAVAPDGRSFYFAVPNPVAPAREVLVVLNWLQETLGSAALGR